MRSLKPPRSKTAHGKYAKNPKIKKPAKPKIVHVPKARVGKVRTHAAKVTTKRVGTARTHKAGRHA